MQWDSKYTSLRSKYTSSHFLPVLPTNGVPGEGTNYLSHVPAPTTRQLRYFSHWVLESFHTLERVWHFSALQIASCTYTLPAQKALSVGRKTVVLHYCPWGNKKPFLILSVLARLIYSMSFHIWNNLILTCYLIFLTSSLIAKSNLFFALSLLIFLTWITQRFEPQSILQEWRFCRRGEQYPADCSPRLHRIHS